MKVLIFNHFFELDIEAMSATRGENEVKIFPFQALRRKASRVFSKEVVDGSFELQKSVEGTPAHDTWKKVTADLLAYLHRGFPFDVFVTPSDTFFYLREFIQQCQSASIPVIVLQKETSISEYTMIHDAAVVGRHFPFMSDLMLACGQRQKQFWINAGTDAKKIQIIGQPRFDIYKNPALRHAHSLIPNSNPSKNILFLSYDLDAYSPDYSEVLQNTWSQLRSETEQCLAELSGLGYNICIKPHPQQRGSDEMVRLKNLFGSRWLRTAHWIDRLEDTRCLILDSDFVIGFQTTALFEAMLAGKHVIYTNWTDEVEQHREQLIPFHEMGDVLKVAQSPEDLTKAVIDASGDGRIFRRQERLAVSVPHTGTFDGKASTRAWNAIGGCCNRAPQTGSYHLKQSNLKTLKYVFFALWLSILYNTIAVFSPLVSMMVLRFRNNFREAPQDWEIKAARMRKSMKELSQFWFTTVKAVF